MKSIKTLANMFIAGTVFGVSLCLIYMFMTGSLPFLKAAGVGTGAPDINAKYHDGYATSLASSSGVIYASNASGYLPTSTIDTNAIVDDTISITADLDLTTDGTGSGLDADLFDGSDSTTFGKLELIADGVTDTAGDDFATNILDSCSSRFFLVCFNTDGSGQDYCGDAPQKGGQYDLYMDHIFSSAWFQADRANGEEFSCFLTNCDDNDEELWIWCLEF